MGVPTLVIKLDKANAALRQAPGQDAVVSESPRPPRVGTVLIEDVRRLVHQFCDLGHARLHAERHFILADARLQFGAVIGRDLLELAQAIQHQSSALCIDSWRIA